MEPKLVQSVDAAAYVAKGIGNLGLGVASGLCGFVSKVACDVAAGVAEEGAKGAVLGAATGLWHGAGNLIFATAGGVAALQKSIRAASDTQSVIDLQQDFMCVREVVVRAGFDQNSPPIRTLAVGEDSVHGIQVICDTLNRLVAVKFADGMWADLHDDACGSLAPIMEFGECGQDLLVCDDSLLVRASWDLDSPIIRVHRFGDIINAKRSIRYEDGFHTIERIQLNDGHWTTWAASGPANLAKRITDTERQAAPDKRALLAQAWRVQDEIDMLELVRERGKAMCGPPTSIQEAKHQRRIEAKRVQLRALHATMANADVGAQLRGNPSLSEHQCFSVGSLGSAGSMASSFISSEGPKCFLGETLLENEKGQFARACDLCQGDLVRGARGELVRVASNTKCPDVVQDLVEFHVDDAFLVVTSTHRVMVYRSGLLQPMPARA